MLAALGQPGEDEFATLVIVPLWRSEFLRAVLEDEDIECLVNESFDPVTRGLVDARILVRRRDRRRAADVLESLG